MRESTRSRQLLFGEVARGGGTRHLRASLAERRTRRMQPGFGFGAGTFVQEW
jgi:hypothetical protein